MAKSQNRPQQEQSQVYDTSLKDWIQQQARDILPLLLPGTVYEDTLNVEVIRPTMRADKVYKVKYQGEDHIFHLEFESGTDTDMPSRLLVYNSILYRDYHLPVISMIVYPFRTKMAESPLRLTSGQKDLLVFHFLTLPLFTLDAEHYVREHALCMYPLLPTMQKANASLIKQAMDELANLYREDEVTLSQQFVWMEILLKQTDTIPPQEKNKIQEQLKMYDQLWEDHPKVKKIRAESEAKGRAEGEAQGEIRALQSALITIVQTRFPALTVLAQQQIAQINEPSVLNFLIQHVITAPEEEMVRWLLHPPAA